jgi:hypothetical protein
VADGYQGGGGVRDADDAVGLSLPGRYVRHHAPISLPPTTMLWLATISEVMSSTAIPPPSSLPGATPTARPQRQGQPPDRHPGAPRARLDSMQSITQYPFRS